MTDKTMDVETTERELVFTRVFDAPRDLVFETFSTCVHLSNWWGPREWPISTCEMDFKEGGSWNYCMKGPEGDLACGRAEYKKIITPETIVYKDYFMDNHGMVNRDLPSGLMTFEFAEQDGKTTLTGKAQYPTPTDLQTVIDMGMVEGMTETLDRLAGYLNQTSG